jgi:hypothetical protein
MAIKIKPIRRGTTRAINVSFEKEDGSPHDLTGGKVFFVATLQDAPVNDAGAAIDLPPVVSHVDAVNGKSRIVLSATDTDIAADKYNVGIQAVLADGQVIEDVGKLDILQDYKKGIA